MFKKSLQTNPLSKGHKYMSININAKKKKTFLAGKTFMAGLLGVATRLNQILLNY